jgi:hypothetical protein
VTAELKEAINAALGIRAKRTEAHHRRPAFDAKLAASGDRD